MRHYYCPFPLLRITILSIIMYCEQGKVHKTEHQLYHSHVTVVKLNYLIAAGIRTVSNEYDPADRKVDVKSRQWCDT